MSTILELNELRKEYHTAKGVVEILKGVTVSFSNGIIGILGPNGAGKTTLIKSCLYLQTYQGAIKYFGKDLHKMSKKDQAFTFSALLEGNRNLYWKLTPVENIKYFTSIRGINFSSIRNIAMHLLHELQLDDKKNVLVENLSRGMQQKTAIICCLCMNTPVVFLDEPTLGLDIESTEHLINFLSKSDYLKKKLLLVTSHDFSFIENVSTSLYKLKNGLLEKREINGNQADKFHFKVKRLNDSPFNFEGIEIIEDKDNIIEFRVMLDNYSISDIIKKIENNSWELILVESEKYNVQNFYFE